MIKQYFKLTLTEFRIFLREPVAVFFNFFFPLMFLLLTMHVFLPEEAVKRGDINYYLPSFIIIITTGVSFFNVPIYIVKYRNNKFLKRLRVAPIRPMTILLSLGTANLLMLVFGLVMITVIGVLFYHASFQGSVFLLIPAIFLSFLSLGSMGLMIASFCRGLRTVNVVGQLIYYPMLFLSGAIPLELSGFLSLVQKVLPITYGVDLVQRLWNKDYFVTNDISFHTGGVAIDIIVLSAVLVICMTISIRLFKWE